MSRLIVIVSVLVLLLGCTSEKSPVTPDTTTGTPQAPLVETTFVNIGLTDRSAIQSILSTDDRIIFAGTRSNGMLRSDDSGATWIQLDSTDWVHLNDVLCIARGIGKSILAGGDNGLFITTNFGRSWKYQPTEFNLIWSVGIDGPNYIAGITHGGYCFSSDFGATWNYSKTGLDVGSMLGVARTPDGTLFAATPSGLHVSTDTNRTWKVSGAIPPIPILSLMKKGDGALFAGTQNGIYRSTDNGASFEKVSNLYGMYLDMNDAGIVVAASEDEIWISANSGNSWKKVFVRSFGNDYIRSLAISPDGRVYCGSYRSGLFRSTVAFKH